MLRRIRVRSGLGALAVAMACSVAPATVQAADAAAGQAAYQVCGACHGPQGAGNQAMNAPRLAGQAGWYIKRQLEAYRSGLRGTAPGDVHGMQMRPMAMSVADPTAVENLIAYIGTFPDAPNAPTVQGDAAAGKNLYMVCGSCHGPDGKGNEMLGGPRLAGQDDWYLVRQLQNYKKGLRGYDPKDTHGMQMKPMAATLADDAAIANVVAYINTLR